MGHGPSLSAAINEKKVNEQALQAEIERVRVTLNNTEDMAINYLNDHTDGVIKAADTGKDEIRFTNNSSYTKYSEEYNLDALDKVIDAVIDTAQKTMTADADSSDNPQAVLDLVGSIGGLVKSGLALAASSSTTTTKLSVTFSQFSVGDKNFAVYNAVNSGIVKASNAWGNKDITLVAQITVLARVKADPNLTQEEAYQDDLNTLLKLEKLRNKEMLDAITKGIDNTSVIKQVEDFITQTRANITKDRSALAGKNLSEVSPSTDKTDLRISPKE